MGGITTSDTLTQEFQTAIADLRQVDPRVGLFRFVTIGIIVLSLMGIAWSVGNLFAFVAITAIAGIFYRNRRKTLPYKGGDVEAVTEESHPRLKPTCRRHSEMRGWVTKEQ